MENQQQIREIIGGFIDMDASGISATTVIDRSALRSSIHVHRMYAALADAGLVVGNPHAIRTFGDLQQAVGIEISNSSIPAAIAAPERPNSEGPFVGIDIEDISSFAAAADYREDEFYKQNFSASEIAWCITQPHPLASFAGRFAAKEAIVKSDNRFMSHPFNRIEILSNPDGRPQFQGFEISISHTPAMAIAVAVRSQAGALGKPTEEAPVAGRDRLLWLFATISFLLALAAFLTR